MADNPFSLLFEPLEHGERESDNTSSNPALESLVKSLSPLLDDVDIETKEIYLSDGERTIDKSIHYDDNGVPVASPLSTLDSVLTWQQGHDDMSVPCVPLCPRIPNPFSEPNVIICHDMMGGYTKDRFIQGYTGIDEYYFYHWQHISAFIYFSHNLVTIPPVGWTNAAHRHGVLSMGTLITEWQDGAKIWSTLLHNESMLQIFAQQLIAIAEYYRFDGWLINIENPIHPSHLDNLYVFLSILVTGIHQRIPGSKVIWYDSVTTTGQLKWQNTLNELNEMYFSLCDGIFLNYHWTRECLHQTQLVSANRSCDVYVGIDVHGRGCFGGGGYNCSIALDVIKRFQLSTAVFAPGWVYENDPKSDFIEKQDRFWKLLSPYTSLYPAVSSLPLVSSFGRGYGHKVSIDGQVVYDGKWTNLSAQDIQPSFPDCYYRNEEKASIQLHSVDVDTSYYIPYNNGSVLSIHGSVVDTQNNIPAIVRLFKCNIPIKDNVLISYTYYCATDNIDHYLRVRISGNMKFILMSPHSFSDVSEQPVIPALSEQNQKLLHSHFTGDMLSTHWKTCYFLLKMPSEEIKGVSICIYPKPSVPEDNFILYIGEVKIMDYRIFQQKMSNVHAISIANKESNSITLFWNHKENEFDRTDHFNIYTMNKRKFKFIGRAHTNGFHMFLPEDIGTFKIYIQPVTISRRKRRVLSNSHLTINNY